MSQCVREIESRTFVQCCRCGKVHNVKHKYHSDDCYIQSTCPKCGHEKALNLGEDINDIYLFLDTNLDSRYYL